MLGPQHQGISPQHLSTGFLFRMGSIQQLAAALANNQGRRLLSSEGAAAATIGPRISLPL